MKIKHKRNCDTFLIFKGVKKKNKIKFKSNFIPINQNQNQ